VNARRLACDCFASASLTKSLFPSLSLVARFGRLLAAPLCLPLVACAVNGQTPQQYVYTSNSTSSTTSVVSGYSKNGQSGALTPLGTPVNGRLEGGLAAVDGQGRFLFILNPVSDDISMFQIDASTGALTEVPGSPFATPPTINPNQAPSSPTCMATEASGQFLYVGFASGNLSGYAAINEYVIDAANQQIVPTTQVTLDIHSRPIAMATDAKGFHLYVATGLDAGTGDDNAEIDVYAIDPQLGNLSLNGFISGGQTGRTMAVDAQGRFLFYGYGSGQGFLQSGLISPVDGTVSGGGANADGTPITLGMSDFPRAMLAEGSGKFLYVAQSDGAHVYGIDQGNGSLAALATPPLLPNLAGAVAADPAGPYIYATGLGGIFGYSVDASTGGVTQIPGSPFSAGVQGAQSIAITSGSVQAVSGPVAAFDRLSADFGSATVGQAGLTRVANLVNTGDQALSVNSIQISGANAADFAATPTCQPPTVLQPNESCAISVAFTPSAAGSRQASLSATDNAPGSPQAIPLTGTGVAAVPGVTIMPASVTFSSLAQGSSSTPQDITVTNSGQTTLNVASVTLTGANQGDFQISNGCGASLTVNSTCNISVTFSPQAAGLRAASINIADDAAGSPQSIALSGTGALPFTLNAGGASTSASITAGQPATFTLQVNPAAGFSGSVTLSCSGAPTAAMCMPSPGSVSVSGGTPSSFSVNVTTTGTSFVPPEDHMRPPSLLGPVLQGILVLAAVLFLLLSVRWNEGARRRRLILAFGCSAVFLMVATFTGCSSGAQSASVTPPPGGGGGGTTPPPVVTPQGTSTLIVTATSGSLPSQSIQLTLIVN
jgi:6-phosphogluconolactonase (cycloisomerase 2 family)